MDLLDLGKKVKATESVTVLLVDTRSPYLSEVVSIIRKEFNILY